MRMKRIVVAALLCLVGLSGAAQANQGCFKDPANNNAPYARGMNREGTRDQMMKQTQDPAQDLAMCFMAIPFTEGNGIADKVKKMRKNCGCQEAVDELCDYEKKDGKYHLKRAKGGAQAEWCIMFMPD